MTRTCAFFARRLVSFSVLLNQVSFLVASNMHIFKGHDHNFQQEYRSVMDVDVTFSTEGMFPNGTCYVGDFYFPKVRFHPDS